MTSNVCDLILSDNVYDLFNTLCGFCNVEWLDLRWKNPWIQFVRAKCLAGQLFLRATC